MDRIKDRYQLIEQWFEDGELENEVVICYTENMVLAETVREALKTATFLCPSDIRYIIKRTYDFDELEYDIMLDGTHEKVKEYMMST